MRGSRLSGWCRPRRWGVAICVVSALTALLIDGSDGLAQQDVGRPNPDWPCRQILVPRLSVAAVWSGPSIEGISWRNDPAVADLVARIAARRIPLDEAEHAIEDFARSQGPGKSKKLIASFAGLFETLNDERTQVIDGLLRFGARQKELAEKIRGENALGQEKPGKASPDSSGQHVTPAAQELEWDLRVFDERRQSLTYVCETPTLIEQRLFALAKVFQRSLE
ncbi:MAG TPA: hypothetical protein VL996_09620 [Methylocella sp.]|nr:hypothetical protein [Methylocella sp.]